MVNNYMWGVEEAIEGGGGEVSSGRGSRRHATEGVDGVISMGRVTRQQHRRQQQKRQ